MTTKPEVGKAQRVPFITKTRSVDEAARTIEFVASDESVDRYGDIIRAAYWKVENYLKNPVVLFAHKSSEPPIGKTVALTIEHTPPALIQTVQFATDDFADRIFKLYAGGFMKAVSVGFKPTKMPKPITDEDSGRTTGWEYVGQELLELSCVPVPANQNALARAVDNGIITAEQRKEFGLIYDQFERELGLNESSEDEEDHEDEGMEEEISMVVCNKKATEKEVETVRSHTQERLSDVMARVFGGRSSENQRPELEKFAEAVNAETKEQLEVLLAPVRAGQQSFFERIEKKIAELGEAQSVHLDRRIAPLARESVVVPELRLVVDTLRSAMTELTELREEIGRVVHQKVKLQLEPLIRTVVREELDANRGRAEAERSEKMVCPYKDEAIADKGTAWDAGAEMGKQTTPMGWRRMCTVIVGDPALKGSYKLPHHQGDGFKVVPSGVRAALERFEGTQMPSADRTGARNHLVKHQQKIANQQGWDFDEKAFEKKLAELGAIYRDYQESGDQKGMDAIQGLIDKHIEDIFPKAKDPIDQLIEEIAPVIGDGERSWMT